MPWVSSATPRSNRILRTVFLVPLVLSPLAAGFVFRALLGLDGTVNTVLSAVTRSDIAIPWLGSGSLTLAVVGLATAWRWFPMILIVFLAGLISIPTDAIDAARIDGAGPIALIRYVKLPLLAPAMTFAVVVSLIVSLNVFETIVVLTDGGPGRTTEVLNFLIIQEFGEGRFASAAGSQHRPLWSDLPHNDRPRRPAPAKRSDPVTAARLPLSRLAGGTRVAVLTLVALVVVGAPIWVVIVNSLKPYPETVSPSLRLPETWMAVENYGVGLRGRGSMCRGFLNNSIVLAVALPLILVLSTAASWAMVRSSSRLLTPLRYAMLVGLVVPPAIVATIFTLKRIGIYGGLLGLGLFYAALFIPLGIFLMFGFIPHHPRHLEEAARIDGASNIDILVRIIIPLLQPALITTTVIVMVAVWNDFLNPFMLLNDPDNNTLICHFSGSPPDRRLPLRTSGILCSRTSW